MRAAARRPPQDCGVICHGSAFLHTTPPVFPQIRKKGGVAASLRGCQTYSSKPCTTVSSVLESNAFAASVTGK